ncbi:hypothetical protein [Actinoplanes xinjiangensis]|uniref:hypothetical protein n=1 Tax=Actinoplanes xinjiangensis TaxID=512350 RepID=UPI00341E9C7E
MAWEDVTALRAAEERARALAGQLGGTLTTIGDAGTSLHSVASAMEQFSLTVSEITRNESRASEVVTEAIAATDAATSTMTRQTDASGRIDELDGSFGSGITPSSV